MTTTKTAKKKTRKAQNPLYVVKGKDVELAKGWIDLVIKKLNLAPVLEVIQALLKAMLEQVNNYAVFKVVKEKFDELVNRVAALFAQLGIV